MASLIPQLQSLLETDDSVLKSDVASQRKALMLARALTVKLETPMDTMLRISYQEAEFAAALKVCRELKVFDILAMTDHFISIKEIADNLPGVDPKLLQRLMRHIAAMGGLREEAPDKYASTAFSKGLTQRELGGGLDVWSELAGPAVLNLPKFLKQTEYKEPADPGSTSWQHATGNHMPAFEWMNGQPELLVSFAHVMSGYNAHRGNWLDFYPMERLLEGAEPEGPLLVDVGGSIGHDIEKFRKKFPQHPGRLIVQDLPGPIAEGKEKADSSIEMMEHDFFALQPVKNARAYYLHSILHDWPDVKAVEILRNLKAAFKQGYSKLLVNDCVIHSTGTSPVVTGLDIIMMSIGSAKERSNEDWENLLNDAGFRIVGIWGDPAVAYESVIEAEPADFS